MVTSNITGHEKEDQYNMAGPSPDYKTIHLSTNLPG